MHVCRALDGPPARCSAIESGQGLDRAFGHTIPGLLAPHDALEGVIDTEALSEELYPRADYLIGWQPYVELAGDGRKTVEIERAAA